LKVFSSVLEAIGNTPLVELSRITCPMPGRILLKLDYLNPGFSKKDRAALRIVEEAERSGVLRPGQPIVELTSGNMGTGLAIVCAVKGYPFVAVMSRGNSPRSARRSCSSSRRQAARRGRSQARTSGSWTCALSRSFTSAMPSGPTSSCARATGTRMPKRPAPRS
jgi:cysteine synthase